MRYKELEQYLISQFDKVDAATETDRMKIYKAAFAAVERLEADKRDALQKDLIIAIERLERNKPWIVTREAQLYDEREVKVQTNQKGHVYWGYFSAFVSAIQRIKIGSDVIFPIAGILLIIPSIFLMLGKPIFTKNDMNGNSPKREKVRENSLVAHNADDIALASIMFPDDITQISSDPYAKKIYKVDENQFREFDSLLIESEQTLYIGPFFKITPKSTYLMSITLALEEVSGTLPNIDAGFVFFDSQKQRFPNDIDAYNFFVNKGKVDINVVATTGNDFQLSNFLSSSDEDTDLRPEKGPALARAVISFAPNKNNGVVLKKLTISRLQD